MKYEIKAFRIDAIGPSPHKGQSSGGSYGNDAYRTADDDDNTGVPF